MRNEFKLGQVVYYAQFSVSDPYTVTAMFETGAAKYLMEIKPAWPGSSSQPVIRVHTVLVYDNYLDCQDYAVIQAKDNLAGAKFMARAMKNDGLQYLISDTTGDMMPSGLAERLIREYLEGQNA